MAAAVYYTGVHVFSIYLLVFVHRFVLFLLTSFCLEKVLVLARLGTVSLFTCVSAVFSLEMCHFPAGLVL